MELLPKTLGLMHSRAYKVRHLCRAVGLSERQFYAIRAGEIANPGVNTVEAIYHYLRKCPERAVA